MKNKYFTVFLIGTLLLPSVANAENEVTIPTTIQVVDENGRTVVSTNTPMGTKTMSRAPFIIPPACSNFLASPTPFRIKDIPLRHPLLTRIESRQSEYDTLVSEISFAPHLPDTTEILLREKLRVLAHTTGTTTTEASGCLRLLDSAVEAQGGKKQERTVDALLAILSGIQYGLRSIEGSTTPPQSKEDALYAGDMLLSLHPEIVSVVLNDEHVHMHFLFPVQIFGRWNATATAKIIASSADSTLETPWWTRFGASPITDIRRKIDAVTPQKPGIEGMFYRAKEIATALTP